MLRVCADTAFVSCWTCVLLLSGTAGEDLWVPLDSLSNKQEDIVLGYFDDGRCACRIF